MGKKTLSQHLMNAVLRFLFLGYATAFAAWWYISPKGFPWNHLRFWSNNVIPIIIVCGSLVCFVGMFRKKRDLVAILIPSYPVATLAFIVTGRILYPISMRIVFLVFLLCCVLSASLHDMNFRRWYFMRRQEYGIMEMTHEESFKIRCPGPAGPWPGAL